MKVRMPIKYQPPFKKLALRKRFFVIVALLSGQATLATHSMTSQESTHLNRQVQNEQKRTQEMAEYRELSQNFPIRQGLKRLQQDKSLTPAERSLRSKALLARHQKKMDSMLGAILGNQKLFPCDVATKFGKLPKIVLMGEHHEKAETWERKQQVFKAAQSKDRGNQYLVAVEGSVFGNPTSEKEWRERNLSVGNGALNFRGIESLEGKMIAFWLSQARAGLKTPQVDFENDETKTKFRKLVHDSRRLLLRWMLSNSDQKEAFKKVEPLLTRTKLTDLFSELSKKTPVTKKSDIEGFIELLPDKGYLTDDQWWTNLMRETLLGLYNAKYGDEPTKVLAPQLEAHLKSPRDGDFLVEQIVSFRNVDFAISIGKLYCEAKKNGRDLYVVMGGVHVQEVERFLKQAASHLEIELELYPGVIEVLR